jgi:hypothetical protein
MKERLALAVVASLVISAGVPVTALEPVDGPDASGPPTVCPNPWDGGSCLGALAAGTYRTTVFETPFTFTVPEGWANYEDLPGNFLLLPPGGDIYGVDAGTSDYVGVYQGVGVGASSGTNCDAVEPGVGLDPTSMVAALAAREGIIVSDPMPVEIGGLPGLMIDVAGDPSSDVGCRDPEVPFPIKTIIAGLGPSDFAHGIVPGFTMRLYLLDRGDTNVVIEVQDVATAPGTADDYQSVIDTIGFSTP